MKSKILGLFSFFLLLFCVSFLESKDGCAKGMHKKNGICVVNKKKDGCTKGMHKVKGVCVVDHKKNAKDVNKNINKDKNSKNSSLNEDDYEDDEDNN